MLYLVDGYNVTRSDPATRDADIEFQREALVTRLRVRGRDLLGVGRIVVVFDGRFGLGLPSGDAAPIDVRFARGESADDLIVRLADTERGQVTVVTSDSGLAGRVLGLGATRVSVLPRERAYDGAKGGRARGGSKRYPARAAGLPPGANKVTEELKNIWLPDDDNKE